MMIHLSTRSARTVRCFSTSAPPLRIQASEPPSSLQIAIDTSITKLHARIVRNEEKASRQTSKKVVRKKYGSATKVRSKYSKRTSSSANSYSMMPPEGQTYEYDNQEHHAVLQGTLRPDGEYTPIEVPGQDPIPQLQHKLSRVLFSPGVHYLQDPRTKVYSFNPYLKHILPVKDFDFKAITTFVTASKDTILSTIAKEHNLKYYASTSSMTGVLSHMHFLLSNFRPSSLKDISRHHSGLGHATFGAKLPATVILRKNDNGCYSIDSDKSTDREMVLSLLGHSLERFLTKTPEEYEQYKKTEVAKTITEANTYHYAKLSSFLMRSQLDCYDARLPGTGTFDLKTRAVAGVRHDLARVEKDMTGYEIVRTQGRYESFEREMVDLARSTMLKYSLQARIGNMDGIFIAYHNIAKMFGFQYLPLSKMDEVLHSFGRDFDSITKGKSGSSTKFLNFQEVNEELSHIQADQEFKISVKLWNIILDEIIEHHLPLDSFRLSVRAVPVSDFETKLRLVASKISADEIDHVQTSGGRLQALMANAVEEEHQEIVDDHIKSIKQLNQKLRHSPIAFDVFVKHQFDDKPTSKRHPILPNSEAKWGVDIKLVQLDKEEASAFYTECLDTRLDMLERSATFKDDEDAGAFISILRAFGKNRELKKDYEEVIVWNDE